MSQFAVYSMLFLLIILCVNSAPVPARRSTNEQCDKVYNISHTLLNHLGRIKDVSSCIINIYKYHNSTFVLCVEYQCQQYREEWHIQ